MSSSGAAEAHPGPPPGGPAPGRAQGRAEILMSIGEVLGQLRAEFPDTTISKLRFLEAEGLVEPQRTAAGYRKYTWDDVARLRYVLSAQRDHYLPLRVIREQLAELERDGGESLARHRPALVAVGPTGDLPGEGAEATVGATAGATVEATDSRFSRSELLARCGLSEQLFSELERHGLIGARSPGWYDADALAVAAAAVELARYGIEPRHLRSFRTAADREVGLFAQLLAPLVRQNDPAARARAAETARELAALSQRVHAALVRAGLRETLER